MKPRILAPDPTEQEIQHAAYLLWEQEGRPVGRDLELWLSAKERLRHTVHPPRQPPLARPAASPPRNAQPPGPENR